MFDTTSNTETMHTGAATGAPVGKSSTKAKKTARAMRVWLENKSLLEAAGFHAGAKYNVRYGQHGYMVLSLDADGNGTVSSCKRGDVVRPIIDLHSAKVASTFNDGDLLTVVYSKGHIDVCVDMLALAIQE